MRNCLHYYNSHGLCKCDPLFDWYYLAFWHILSTNNSICMSISYIVWSDYQSLNHCSNSKSYVSYWNGRTGLRICQSQDHMSDTCTCEPDDSVRTICFSTCKNKWILVYQECLYLFIIIDTVIKRRKKKEKKETNNSTMFLIELMK